MAVGVVDVTEEVEVGHDHGHRPLEARGAGELLAKLRREVTSVEEARLGIDACLLLEGRNAERAMNQEERGDGGGKQIGIPAPEARKCDTETREDEVCGEAVPREEPCFTERVSPREVEHRREKEVVHEDEDDTGCEAGDCHFGLAREPQVLHERNDPPRRQSVQRVVADVEALDVPGVANLQPFRNVLHDAHEDDELRWQQEGSRDQEDDGRVVRLIPRRADDEELRDGCARGKQEEGRPAVRVRRKLCQRRHRDDDGDDPDQGQIELCFARERRLVLFRRLSVLDAPIFR